MITNQTVVSANEAESSLPKHLFCPDTIRKPHKTCQLSILYPFSLNNLRQAVTTLGSNLVPL